MKENLDQNFDHHFFELLLEHHHSNQLKANQDEPKQN
jgi:hypothetical protein